MLPNLMSGAAIQPLSTGCTPRGDGGGGAGAAPWAGAASWADAASGAIATPSTRAPRVRMSRSRIWAVLLLSLIRLRQAHVQCRCFTAVHLDVTRVRRKPILADFDVMTPAGELHHQAVLRIRALPALTVDRDGRSGGLHAEGEAAERGRAVGFGTARATLAGRCSARLVGLIRPAGFGPATAWHRLLGLATIRRPAVAVPVVAVGFGSGGGLRLGFLRLS